MRLVVERWRIDGRAGRDVHRHDARLLPRPVAAPRAGDIQVLRAHRHHRAAAHRPQQSSKSGLTTCPTTSAADRVPQALRQLAPLPAGAGYPARGRHRRGPRPGWRLVVVLRLSRRCSTRTRYFDYTAMIIARRRVPRRRRGRGRRRSRASRPTSAMTSGTSWSTSTRTSTRCRSGSIRGLTRFGANLCVVGDDDQTIYQWRGSEVRNIITFADRYADVEQVTLDDNFRSSERRRGPRPLHRRAHPAWRAAGQRRWSPAATRAGNAATCSRSSFRRCRSRGGLDVRPHRARCAACRSSMTPAQHRGGSRGRTSPSSSAPSQRTPAPSSRNSSDEGSRTSSRA